MAMCMEPTDINIDSGGMGASPPMQHPPSHPLADPQQSRGASRALATIGF